MTSRRLVITAGTAWLAAAAGIGAAAAPPAQAQGSGDGRVAVYPSPGTRTAGVHTQISFRGRRRADLGSITVRGSRSGRVGGRLRAHSDGAGASWVPRRRFKPGERVTVRTGVPVVGARNGDFAFRVGRFPHRVTIPNRILEDIAPGKRLRFRSRPDLRPPVVTVDPGQKATAPGHVFITPKSKKDLAQAGPMIVDNRGEPIWFHPLKGIRAATDFRAQTYRGRPVLTYWEGTSRQGIGVGDLVILDEHYRPLKRFKRINGFRPDLHEFLITPQNTALLITYPPVRANLSRFGGARRGILIDSVIQEIDIATGLVVFEWHSIGKIGLRESFSKPTESPTDPWDYVHTNGVSLDTDGDLLMSARNTWGVYKIDRRSGRIEWRLGGKRSDFELGRGVRFAWQHDAQRRADGAITIFDNSAFPPVRKHSRAIAVRLDEDRMKATLASAWTHPGGLLAATQGNYQTLPDGGAFVGWGSQRYFNEFGPDGDVRWNARVALGYETYRAYRLPWVGRPATRPRAAALRRDDRMDVYASWNGATVVSAWQVLGGSSPDDLSPIGSAQRTGFETRIRVPTQARYVAVRAFDAGGNALSTSPAVRTKKR